MRMKKLTALLLSAVMVLNTLAGTCSAASQASAQPPSWAASAVENIRRNGLVYEEQNMTGAITRGNFCEMLVKLIQAEMSPSQGAAVPVLEAGYFSDISGSVSDLSPGGRNGMYYAAAYGVTEGGTDASGRRVADVNSSLTREQAAKMMCSAIDFLEKRVLNGEIAARGQAADFGDIASVSSWAKSYVEQASAMGIMLGDEQGRFNPRGTITWYEAAVMVSRTLDAANTLRGKNLAAAGQRFLNSESSFELPTSNGPLYFTPREDELGDSLFLATNGTQGGYTTLWTRNDVVYRETFSEDGTSRGMHTLPAELPILIDFLETDENFYIAYGQENPNEDDNLESIRIVKYDRAWNRVDALSVKGGDTGAVRPARSTRTSEMVLEGDQLVLHTSKLMYTLVADGVRHQANLTIWADADDMSLVKNSYTEYTSSSVSHSFAQQVIFSDGVPVFADLGDASPRGFAISMDNVQPKTVLPFYGARGDNNTYSILGGFEASEDYYLLAGASTPQNGEATQKTCYQNAVLILTPKDDFSSATPTVKWLTNYTDGSRWVQDVKMEAINNNTFVVMWQEGVASKAKPNDGALGDFCYAVFDGEGNQVGQTQRLPDYRISERNVVVDGNRLLWVRPSMGAELRSEGYTSATENLILYTITVEPNQPTADSEPVTFSISPDTLELEAWKQATGVLTPNMTGVTGTPPTVLYTSSDVSIVVPKGEGTLEARVPGTVVITASMTYRGREYTDTCTVTVVDDGNSYAGYAPGELIPDYDPSPDLTKPYITKTFEQTIAPGKVLRLEVLDGNRLRFSGYGYDDEDLKTVVLRCWRNLSDPAPVTAPFTPGEEFSVTYDIDMDWLLTATKSGYFIGVTAVISSSSKVDGSTTGYGGFGFKDTIYLSMDKAGEPVLCIVPLNV